MDAGRTTPDGGESRSAPATAGDDLPQRRIRPAVVLFRRRMAAVGAPTLLDPGSEQAPLGEAQQRPVRTRGRKRPVSATSKTSASDSSAALIRIGSLDEEEPCWMAFVTASLMASLT